MTTSSPPHLSAPEVTIWTSPARATLAGELLDVMGAAVRPIGVGGPRSAEVEALAKPLDCPVGNDFRKLLIDCPAAFLLVTSLQDVKVADLRAAAESGTRVICLEPLAAELSELDATRTPGQPDAVIFAPAFNQSPGLLSAADPADHLGRPRLVRFSSLGRPQHGSLLARLTDAWAAVLGFVELPETVCASLTQAPDGPRQLAGHFAAHARCADGSSVILEAADHAAASRRELSVLSDSAQLRITDADYELLQPDGQPLDTPEGTAASSAGAEPLASIGFIDLIAHQWRQVIERPTVPTPPSVTADALACIQAALLSARTGQPERPGKLLELSRT